MFVALAKAAELRLGEFTAQDVANIVWAFAKVDQRVDVLLAILSKAVTPRLGDS